jgi:flagellin
MAIGINSNLSASSATRNLDIANTSVSGSVAKLSSGNRIIKASDDVAGLAIGTSISSTVKTLEISLLNAAQASSVLSIADGALAQIGDILARQKSLATQANSGSLGLTERGYLNQEFQALISEIDRIVDSTTFNGITLLDGTLGASTDGLSALASTVTFTDTGTVGSTALDGTTFTLTNDNGNSAVIGSTADISVTGDLVFNNTAVFTITLEGVTYTAEANIVTTDANLTLAFTNQADTGATITIILDTYTGGSTQGAVNTIAAAIQADLDALTVYQSRTVATTTGNITSTTLDGTILEGLDGGDFQIQGTAFDVVDNTAPVVGAFSVTAETTTSDGDVTVTLGGVTYSTVADQFDSTDADDLQAGSLGGGTGIIRLYRAGDSTTYANEYIDIDITVASGAVVDNAQLDSAGAAQLLEDALNTAFGVGSAGALSFQVGAAVTDEISVDIDSVTTTDVFVDDAGDAATLDITTQTGAQDAIEVLDNAIASVISRRADVGAAQSRFNFASANLEVSISNQDAARGSFLDADIANESTRFATAQVKLQASIAVLAQANALPRNLLQLLQ